MNKSLMSHELSEKRIAELMSYWIRSFATELDSRGDRAWKKIMSIKDLEDLEFSPFDSNKYQDFVVALHCAYRFEEIQNEKLVMTTRS